MWLQNIYGKSDVFYYYFDKILPGKEAFGAFHSSELMYFYRNLDKADEKWEETDWKI